MLGGQPDPRRRHRPWPNRRAHRHQWGVKLELDRLANRQGWAACSISLVLAVPNTPVGNTASLAFSQQ